MYLEKTLVTFPEPTNININMMPIIFGDLSTYPKEVKLYENLINACAFDKGSIAYVSIHESLVQKGKTQRRPGIHTEGGSLSGWGGGWGGTEKGLYMASTDGNCRIWNCLDENGNKLGALPYTPNAPSELLKPNTLYWLTDRTPHEAVPSSETAYRQWFRLVSSNVGLWYAKHSTANPLGVQPNCKIIYEDKFL